jgi:tetratricopeptide (TPR) repeat protein
VLAVHPQNAGALNDLAWILAEARQAYEEALPLADRGLQLAPKNTHLLDTRGVILSNLPGRLRDARRDFEKCVELTEPGTPARAKALLQLGRTYARLDDGTGARRCLQEALEIDREQDVFTTQERGEISELKKQTDAG